MVFGIVFLYSAWKYSGMIKEIAPLFIVRTLIICIPLIVFSFLSRSAGRFYYREEIDFSRLDQYSFFGNPYSHDTLSAETENGYHVWIYVNEDELREGWNSLSQYKYDGKDKRGQDVRYTLIRYMTSKGLRKDISGLRSLDPADIFAIEKGNTNYLFLNRFSLYPRVYEVLWEIEKYRRGEDPGGHSVAQRLVYLKAAVSIIRENPVFGTGTGDVRKELIRYYENNVPELDSRWWGPAHNQFITFLVVFGITGFVLAMAFFFLPPVLEKRHRSYLFNVFFIIVILSMLTDDTLETQTGVSFVMFFYSLFVFGNGEN